MSVNETYKAELDEFMQTIWPGVESLIKKHADLPECPITYHYNPNYQDEVPDVTHEQVLIVVASPYAVCGTAHVVPEFFRKGRENSEETTGAAFTSDAEKRVHFATIAIEAANSFIDFVHQEQVRANIDQVKSLPHEPSDHEVSRDTDGNPVGAEDGAVDATVNNPDTQPVSTNPIPDYLANANNTDTNATSSDSNQA